MFAQVVETLADEFNITAEKLESPFALHITPQSECPYTFAAKTLRSVLEFLCVDRARRYSRSDGSPMAWNVKAYRINVNGTADGYKPNRKLDSAWSKYLDTKAGEDVNLRAYEQAQEYYRAEWCAYPGDDQGDWRFSFGGRSGGWLMLDSWQGNRLDNKDSDEFARFLATLVAEHIEGHNQNLSRFYIGIVCADSDFTPEKASQNVSAEYSAAREFWEDERKEITGFIQMAIMQAANRKAEEYGYNLDSEVLEKQAKKAAQKITKGLEV
jgi:hypothetical protein